MRKIPFSPPDITESEISEVVDALKSGLCRVDVKNFGNWSGG